MNALSLLIASPNDWKCFLPGSRLPDIVIDHHYIRSYSKKVKIKDIRPNIGSTCTIITEYYKKLNILHLLKLQMKSTLNFYL